MTSTVRGGADLAAWDPDLYLGFARYRLRPALELLGRIPPIEPSVIYDLGCGPGNVTRLIAEKWASATVVGVDQSIEMLERAAEGSGRVSWVESDIGSWTPVEPADLIWSNATLHWLEDHHTLFPRLAGYLRPGGCLAVQMPLNWGAPSHRLMAETLADGGPGGHPLGGEGLRLALSGGGFWRRWNTTTSWPGSPRFRISGRPSICTCWRGTTRSSAGSWGAG